MTPAVSLDNEPYRPFTPFPCPACGEVESRIIDTRSRKNGSARRRRYKCRQCKHLYSTYEIYAGEYEKIQRLKVDEAQFDSVIATLNVIKSQLGESNGRHGKD